VPVVLAGCVAATVAGGFVGVGAEDGVDEVVGKIGAAGAAVSVVPAVDVLVAVGGWVAVGDGLQAVRTWPPASVSV